MKVNVLHISKTSIYNNVGDVLEALQIMKNRYGSSTNWHYTDPNGHQPDLHHALLYESRNGGEVTLENFDQMLMKKDVFYFCLFCLQQVLRTLVPFATQVSVMVLVPMCVDL